MSRSRWLFRSLLPLLMWSAGCTTRLEVPQTPMTLQLPRGYVAQPAGQTLGSPKGKVGELVWNVTLLGNTSEVVPTFAVLKANPGEGLDATAAGITGKLRLEWGRLVDESTSADLTVDGRKARVLWHAIVDPRPVGGAGLDLRVFTGLVEEQGQVYIFRCTFNGEGTQAAAVVEEMFRSVRFQG
ncbi:MAG: hypothetical protein AB2A00_17110 [Myxococcota bacterium]